MVECAVQSSTTRVIKLQHTFINGSLPSILLFLVRWWGYLLERCKFYDSSCLVTYIAAVFKSSTKCNERVLTGLVSEHMSIVLTTEGRNHLVGLECDICA